MSEVREINIDLTLTQEEREQAKALGVILLLTAFRITPKPKVVGAALAELLRTMPPLPEDDKAAEGAQAPQPSAFKI